MKAKIEAGAPAPHLSTRRRSSTRAKRASDPAERARAQAAVDLLTPVVKAWATDLGCEAASLGIQVHGGMGYVEENRRCGSTPCATRVSRRSTKGTNGIQANDLVFRKVLREQRQCRRGR